MMAYSHIFNKDVENLPYGWVFKLLILTINLSTPISIVYDKHRHNIKPYFNKHPQEVNLYGPPVAIVNTSN